MLCLCSIMPILKKVSVMLSITKNIVQYLKLSKEYYDPNIEKKLTFPQIKLKLKSKNLFLTAR